MIKYDWENIKSLYEDIELNRVYRNDEEPALSFIDRLAIECELSDEDKLRITRQMIVNLDAQLGIYHPKP